MEEAGLRLLAKVPLDSVAGHLPRSARRRWRRSAHSGRLRVRPEPRPGGLWRLPIRRLRGALDSLPERQPSACPRRIRNARDPRVQRSLAFAAASITGDGEAQFHRSATAGPGFRCGYNHGDPCAWGATKAVLALARVPAERRAPEVARALDEGAGLLLSRDPSVADYPMGPNTRPSGSWFALGFPSGYVADLLQTLEALCEAGRAADRRLDRAVDWVVAQQDDQGRWSNRHAYAGMMVRDIDRPGRPSRWVTLRVCRVLKAVAKSRANA